MGRREEKVHSQKLRKPIPNQKTTDLIELYSSEFQIEKRNFLRYQGGVPDLRFVKLF